jgi:hypothetical protein
MTSGKSLFGKSADHVTKGRAMSSISPKITAMCFALLTLTACAGGGDHEDPPPETTVNPVVPSPPLPPVPPPLPPARYDDVVELVFENGLSRSVYELYVAPTESNSWGRDLLGSRVLHSGAAASFESERCDAYYDVLAVGAGGVQIARKNRIYMRCGTIHTIRLSL